MTKFPSDFIERPDDADARIDQVLAAAYRPNGSGKGIVAAPSVGDELAAFRAAEDEMDSVERLVQIESIGRMLQYFFERGHEPAVVVRRVFMFTESYKPELLGSLSKAQIARLFGETRAAVSHRGMELTGKLHLAGAAGTRTRSQKSAAACAKFSKGAKGNRNRAKKTERAAA